MSTITDPSCYVDEVSPADPVSGRRRFLLASATLAVNAMCCSKSSAADAEVLLQRGDHDLFRVRVEMEVDGNVNVPKNPLISRKGELKLPIKSDAVFDYEERFHRPSGAIANSAVTMAERYYHEARSRSQLNRGEKSSQLRESVREAIVRRELLPEVIYAVNDYFIRDELELR